MKEVRELSYDIENYIDSFVLPGRVANIKTRSGRRCHRIRLRHIKITRLLETNKKLNRRKRVAARISDFRIDAGEALERHKRYELHCCASIRRVLLPAAGRLPTTCEEGAGVIIDDRMRKFMDSMADDRDPQLKVVSVVGSEGIGKTTLVKVLYHKLKGQFDCRAFIRLTRKPDIKTVLRDILTQVQKQQPHNHCDDPDLLGKIREHLQYERYLIIIDDLWSASIWDVISYAFPGGKMCSRIITSTQIEDVALACCYYHSEYVFKMRPLDEDLSRKIFFNSLFCPENDFPQKLEDVLSKIVKICGGLPLATTVIASLLATHPVILMEQWTYIYDSLSSKLRTSSSASEGMKLILNFSYNNLTCHLKTCLLYLSMYPEGFTVCKDDLVKQWVAEGFIGGTEGREVETAESYFHELIGRRFLQPECIKYTGEVVSCSVPEVVRDLIAQKSLEENFIVVLDHYRRSVSLSEKVHRLSLHSPHTKYAMTNIRPSQVWSLTCFGLSKCMPSIREFKLLRVLNLNISGHDDDGDDIIDLTWISELLRLRYLKVASDVCIELPKHMGGLQYLETLDISKKVTDVQSDIIHLPCLLHLHLPFETNLMDWLGMTGPAASVWSLGKLTNLRYLYITYSVPVPDHLQRNMEALGSLFRGHGSLKTLVFILSRAHKSAVALGSSEETITWDWDDFAPPLLERFEWMLHSCSFSRVPKWIGKLDNLCILKISVRELMRDGVNILGELPALTTLSLYVKIPPVERIIFNKAGFSVLKYFKFICTAVPWLKFEADAMPNLQKLKLGFSTHRVDQQSTIPISIEHLPSLEEISAKVGDASSNAESALMAAVSNHPRNPRIRVQLVDWNSYGHGVWYTTSSLPKVNDFSMPFSPEELFRQSEKESKASLIIPSSTSGKDSLNHHQQMKKSTEREHLFEKVVTPSDVGKLNRLVVPKQHAERYFPLSGDSCETGLVLSFEDEAGKQWQFRYSYWNSSQSYVLTKGWGRYVKEKRLDAGDVLRFERMRGFGMGDRLFISYRRAARRKRPVRDLSPYGPLAPARSAGGQLQPSHHMSYCSESGLYPTYYHSVDLYQSVDLYPTYYHSVDHDRSSMQHAVAGESQSDRDNSSCSAASAPLRRVRLLGAMAPKLLPVPTAMYDYMGSQAPSAAATRRDAQPQETGQAQREGVPGLGGEDSDPFVPVKKSRLEQRHSL